MRDDSWLAVAITLLLGVGIAFLAVYVLRKRPITVANRKQAIVAGLLGALIVMVGLAIRRYA
jgi:hypothetical protein